MNTYISSLFQFITPSTSLAAVCTANGQVADCPGNLLFAAPLLFVIWLAVLLLIVISYWKVFSKAGQPGWASIIPIYNIIVLFRITNRPWWWFFLFLIPIVNWVIMIILMNDLAKSFGKGLGFTLGLIFLSIIFFPILAFGGSTYTKPVRDLMV
ncbi:MAG: DUF5684 domain-containing protein [Patescibacteria group bacterium]